MSCCIRGSLIAEGGCWEGMKWGGLDERWEGMEDDLHVVYRISRGFQVVMSPYFLVFPTTIVSP